MSKCWLWVLALSVPCCVHAQNLWPDERTAGPFSCHANFPLDQHTYLLDELARLQRDLVRTLGTAEPRERIDLYLFDRQSTYESYLKLWFPEVPSRRALYIKERGSGMVFAYRTNEFEIDVRHEGTHALLHADLPMVPLWLDEGLAEYFEAPYQKRAFEHPHFRNVKWSTKLGQIPRIERLEQIQTLEQMGPSEYRQSWAWVHFMLHGSPAAHEELLSFLADIRAHTPPGQLSNRLSRRIPDLNQQFAEHFRNWKP